MSGRRYKQPDLFALANNEVNVVVGSFFEELALSWFEAAGIGPMERRVRFRDSEIDLVAWSNPSFLIEVKAFNAGRGKPVRVPRDQAKKYEGLLDNSFPFTDPRIFYLLIAYRAWSTFTRRKFSHFDIRSYLKEQHEKKRLDVWFVPLAEMRGVPEEATLSWLRENLADHRIAAWPKGSNKRWEASCSKNL